MSDETQPSPTNPEKISVTKFQHDDPLAVQIDQLLHNRLGDLPQPIRDRLDQFARGENPIQTW